MINIWREQLEIQGTFQGSGIPVGMNKSVWMNWFETGVKDSCPSLIQSDLVHPSLVQTDPVWSSLVQSDPSLVQSDKV